MQGNKCAWLVFCSLCRLSVIGSYLNQLKLTQSWIEWKKYWIIFTVLWVKAGKESAIEAHTVMNRVRSYWIIFTMLWVKAGKESAQTNSVAHVVPSFHQAFRKARVKLSWFDCEKKNKKNSSGFWKKGMVWFHAKRSSSKKYQRIASCT